MMGAVMLGVLAALNWSLHDVLARGLAQRVGPFRMAALVMIFGGLALTGYVLWTGTVWQAPREAWIESLLLGIAYGCGVGGLFKALSLGPISVVGPVTASYPILVVLWGMLHGLAPTLLQWAAVAAALGGAAVVMRAGHPDGGLNAVIPGKLKVLAAFCVLSGLGYASAIVLSQSAAVSMGEIEATWVSRASALLPILPFLAAETRPAPLRPRHWLAILAMGIFDVIGVAAVAASGHLPGKEFAAIGISAYGGIVVLLAMIVLKEKVTAGQWGGIALLAAGVATLSLSQ